MKRRTIIRYIRNTILFFIGSSLTAVILLRFIPIYFTPLMFIRCGEQLLNGEEIRLKHHWVSSEHITPHLAMAVIASEDNRFPTHHGFDFVEMKKAINENKKRKKARGASTISQQTAKNVFLWPQSSWIRKGFEVYFTVLIELFWSKERIMEVYLNSIEMGDGIYGAYAVAKYHFNTTPDKLTHAQCALIAASLPNPRRLNSAHPGRYMYRRQQQVLRLMRILPPFPVAKQ